MADNLLLNPGTGGKTVATDDILGVDFPRGKLTLGADGVNDGDVSKTNPLPVGGNTAANGSGTETRLLTDAAGHLQVDVLSSASVAVTGTFWQATQPVSAASLPLPSGAATAANQSTANTALNVLIGHVDGLESEIVNAVTALQIIDDWDQNNRCAVNLIVGQAGISAGAGAVDVTTPRVTLASDDPAVSALAAIQARVNTPAATTGGATPLKVISTASTNPTSVKASAGTLFALVVTNTNAAVRYLKLYDLAVAPTVGTSTPVLTIAIPGNPAGAGVVVPIPNCGIAFGTGIALALTTGAADSDTGAVAANEILVAGAYA